MVTDKKYYDGSKLLSMLDADGNKPEIFLCSTNRTAGKTFYFLRWMIRRAIEHNEVFMMLYRYAGDLDSSICGQLNASVMPNCFPDYILQERFLVPHTVKVVEYTKAQDLNEDEKSEWHKLCYAVTLNKAGKVKEYSHLLSDTTRMFMDEFQECNNKYLSNEVDKLITIHMSVARGYGEQTKYCPIYLCGNHISTLNPYYLALGISHRLQKDTHYMKGTGWVLESQVYESAGEAMKSSGFNKAFAGTQVVKSSADGIYLNDSETFVADPSAFKDCKEVTNIFYDGKYYALCAAHTVDEIPVMYVKSIKGRSTKKVFAVRHIDHNAETIMLQGLPMVDTIKTYYRLGAIRFQDIMCKQIIYEVLKVDLYGE